MEEKYVVISKEAPDWNSQTFPSKEAAEEAIQNYGTTREYAERVYRAIPFRVLCERHYQRRKLRIINKK